MNEGLQGKKGKTAHRGFYQLFNLVAL